MDRIVNPTIPDEVTDYVSRHAQRRVDHQSIQDQYFSLAKAAAELKGCAGHEKADAAAAKHMATLQSQFEVVADAENIAGGRWNLLAWANGDASGWKSHAWQNACRGAEVAAGFPTIVFEGMLAAGATAITSVTGGAEWADAGPCSGPVAGG